FVFGAELVLVGGSSSSEAKAPFGMDFAVYWRIPLQ
nr:hypothetical protein [Tanacetum cinerariifolium]